MTTSEDANEQPNVAGMQALRKAIPPHCFQPNQLLSSAYIVRDLTFVATLAYLALSIQNFESWITRAVLWTIYGFVQGLVFTGIWILAHECGHKALFKNSVVNDSVGWFLHSLLLVPFFSWQYSHARHHRYTNHMEKDTAFVPQRKGDFSMQAYLARTFDMMEDAPLMNAVLIFVHQLIGWPLYLFFAITSGTGSSSASASEKTLTDSHFDPLSKLFSSPQRIYVLLSDIGLACTMAGLYQLGKHIGHWNMLLMYTIPYLWVNHWIVAITYLHHTHPSALHYEDSTWTYQKGALATVDRDFGAIGRYLFHGIIEFHVIHHLFPRIPFYYAEEATESIEPLLGKLYLRQKTSFVKDFWRTFVHSTYVESVKERPGVLTWASHTGWST